MGLIVVGTDGSENAEAAIREGIDLARRLDAKAVFVAVAPPAHEYLGRPLYEEKVHENLDRARRAVEQARTLAEEAGVEAEYEVLEGDPAEELAALAELRDADLVIVGTRGHGAIVGDLLGSVSAGTVRRSKRPVVIVRDPGVKQEQEAAERIGEVRPAAT